MYFYRFESEPINFNNQNTARMKKVLCVLIATPSFLMAQQQVTSVQTAKPKAVQPQTISGTSASNQNNTSNSNTYPMTVSSNGSLASTSSQVDYNEKWNSFSENIRTIVISKLQQVYGSYYDQLVRGKKSILSSYADFYQRCEIIPISEAPTSLQNITSVGLIEKYNPSYVYGEQSNGFVEENFNLFIYRFNVLNKEDLYFKLYNSDYVLKINKLN